MPPSVIRPSRSRRRCALPGATRSDPRIRIRRARPRDADQLERFYAELSAESRFFRFFGTCRGISRPQSVSFCTPDHAHREGFVAVLRDDAAGTDRIVGHLCLEPAGDGTAEVAIAVSDPFQSHGIGHELLAAGIRWARSVGIDRLSAMMLPSNGRIARLLASLGYQTTVSAPEPDVAEIAIDLRRPIASAA